MTEPSKDSYRMLANKILEEFINKPTIIHDNEILRAYFTDQDKEDEKKNNQEIKENE